MRIQFSAFTKNRGLFFLLALVSLPIHAEPKAVGKISFARGSNAAQQPGAAPRILDKGAAVFQGDNIQTTERSFVIIEFNDGAKVTVRPNTSFSIDNYESQSATPKARLALHEGGVRASSGAIAERNPDNFQIKTDLATVNAQQADYSVRICRDDCQQEQNQQTDAAPEKTDPNVVARISDIKGEVYAANRGNNGNAKERQLSLGSPLYNEDYLHSEKDSYALMVFRDGEKITLQPASEMAIAHYSYQRPNEKDRALYRLTTGGMRVLTGSIGKANKDAFAIDTPVGTIGIRGTGFDLSCVGACVNNQPINPGQIRLEQPAGLYSHVWQGQIALVNDSGEHLLTMPNSNYVANRNTDALDLPGMPPMLFNLPVPRPDMDRSNLQQLFGASRQKDAPAGLYVAVHKGRAQLNPNAPAADKKGRLVLGKNEAGYVNSKKGMARLAQQQRFQTRDPYSLTTEPGDKREHPNLTELPSGDREITIDGDSRCETE